MVLVWFAPMRSSSSSRTGQGISPSSAIAGEGLSFVRAGDVAGACAAELRELASARRTLTEEAWVAFLSCHEWQWFGTFTYKDPIHPEASDKQFRFWTRMLDAAHGITKKAPATAPDRLMWTRGLEWQKRGVLHYHALIRCVPWPLQCQRHRTYAENLWREISGGFAKIKIAASEDVLAYVTKYSVKGGEVDFSPNFELPDGRDTSRPVLAVQG